MYKLVLLRHGESEWNQANLFTGWTDVDLSEKGVQEAKEAGKRLKENGIQFRYAFTSYLKRAVKTLFLTLNEMDRLWIPVEKSWRLNEKHYGMLQGMNKVKATETYGKDQVLLWRRSWDVAPEPIPTDDPRHPSHDPRYTEAGSTPGTEALKDTAERIMPYWESRILPTLKAEKEVLVAAHGNSLRAIVKLLKGMSNEEIISFNIPTAIPYVFEFDADMRLSKDYFLADPEELKQLMEKVANQGKAK
ncbi:MAG: 2,3-diphosphoglycerate-dependent phosphoglycerate mutase [Bacteroidales bacterium]|nr:2,3-diphosphoglycerate-dependent phosphoglycerate mutase [Bacteroidales bacterium]